MSNPIWSIPLKKFIQPSAKRKAFMKDLINLYHYYGISIAHEDSGGSFIIEPYHEYNLKWLKHANDNLTEEE